jgi:Papain family cysteine protease
MSHFIFTQADGSSRSVKGYRYAAPKAASKRYVGGSSVSRLPAKVDLRNFMTPVEQQGGTYSCAANATAGAYEYLIKRHLGQEAYDVSRLFIYYNARAVDDPNNIEDEGSFLQSVIESLQQHGACSEETWPFEEGMVNDEPSEEAYEEAKQFLIEENELVPTDLNAWKTALAEGNPIIFGVKLFGSFDKHKPRTRAGTVSVGSWSRKPLGTRDVVRGVLGPGPGVHRAQFVGTRVGRQGVLLHPLQVLNERII